MQSLENKIIVVTGASQGIGEAIAKAFASEKAKIVLAARNKTRLNKAGKSLSLDKSNYLTISSDVTKRLDMKKIVAESVKKFGRIDIFVNNAGVGSAKPIVETTEQLYDAMFDTNLKSVYYSFLELIPLMKKQGGGQIINISSGAGRSGVPGIAAYSASKAALNALSEAVAGEVRNDNIKVSVLAPASTDTDFMSNLSKLPKTIKRSPRLRNKLTPAEVAEAVLHIAKQNRNAWTVMTDLRPLIIKK